MKMHVLFYTFIFLLCFLLGTIQAPIPLIGLLLIVSMGGYMYVQISPILFSKDVKKSEKYLIKHQKNPMYQLYYAIANNKDAEAETALAAFNAKYKNSYRQALLNTTYAVYKKDLQAAKENVRAIKQASYRLYYEAFIAIESKQLNKAREIADQLPQGWMKESIYAEIFEKQGNKTLAIEHAKKAFEQTRGLQRYMIYKNNESYFAS
ncbi:hypothetical protein [Bacillus sp. UMB0893]|uniref:hypothetical protein n=1 Tax=Bacillus sp. UMB0893 TaxID=2066053 RepID=UPI000C761ABD|nr:hypothetical protein [Bacillus sp. UMB0893]PLR66900.1 hypothetical protein CYJ36_16705 [Bacillus sp. UMB0893]QNG61588.1 hypothetical protein H4O14_08975 [Bacillus sp. PAMC26568]